MPTLAHYLRTHAATRGNAPAVTFENETLTYTALDRRTNEVAAALIEAGFGDGGRFAYLGKNTADFILLLLGAAKAGTIVVPLNWRLSVPELVTILNDAEAGGLLLSEEFASLAADFAAPCPKLETILNCGRASESSFRRWASRPGAQDPHRDRDVHQTIVQLYTSGTTGRAKGVMLSHHSFVSVRQRSADGGIWWDTHSPDDVMLLTLTVGHVGGLVVVVRALFPGAHNVVLREFDAGRVLRAVEDHRVSRITVVPSILQMMLEHPDAEAVDFSALKIIQYGAAPMPPDLLRSSIARFGCDFVQVYGMTETGGTVVTLGPHDHDPAGNDRMRSVGQALPGVEISIGAADATAMPGAVGEIFIRSDALMTGYWHLPAETAAALSADNWLSTGDAGYLDADGYLYLCDRIKDMICTGAENVYPAEVEGAIYSHPAVKDVAVIGIPDPKWGEAVKAIVVLHDGKAADADELIEHARGQIARYKVPKSVDFVVELSRNAAGKVERRKLREPFWAGYDRQI